MKTAQPAPAASPYVIVIDTREQRPFTFAHLATGYGSRPLPVSVEVSGLRSGDYSVRGHEHEIAVERKSLADLYGTLGKGRKRFEREMERLNAMMFAAVVIEASWDAIVEGYSRSRLSPVSVHRTVVAWSQRYPRVHWWPMGSREFAEVTTLRTLERWWLDRRREAKGVANG